MSLRDQRRWELSQLNQPIEFDVEDIQIDLAPFQLVEQTPIAKVHRLFTVMTLRRAYVTQLGSLVGVIGLKELRHAVEDVNSGKWMMETDSHSVGQMKNGGDNIKDGKNVDDVERVD